MRTSLLSRGICAYLCLVLGGFQALAVDYGYTFYNDDGCGNGVNANVYFDGTYMGSVGTSIGPGTSRAYYYSWPTVPSITFSVRAAATGCGRTNNDLLCYPCGPITGVAGQYPAYHFTGPAAPATNNVSIACYTWTNQAPTWAMVEMIAVDSCGNQFDITDEVWGSARAVAPRRSISGCVTNNGVSPDGCAWCTGTNAAALYVFDARHDSGSGITGAFYPASTCSNSSANTNNTTAWSGTTNGVSSTWDMTNGLPVTASSTNGATSADINRLGNLTFDAAGGIEKAIRDGQVGGSTSNLVSDAGTHSRLDTANAHLAGIESGISNLTMTAGSGGFGSPQGTNYYTQSLAYMTNGTGTNYSTWLNSKGTGSWYYALPTGTNVAGQAVTAFGMAQLGGGGGDGPANVQALGDVGNAPPDAWGKIFLCTLGGQDYYLDLKQMLSFSFFDDAGWIWSYGFVGFRTHLRTFLLWTSVVIAIWVMAGVTKEAVAEILKIPQLPNYDVTVLGTTVPGANEAARVLQWAVLSAALVALPSIITAVIATILSYAGYPEGTTITQAVQASGVVDAGAGVGSFGYIFYCINQWFPLIEEIIILTNTIVGCALLSTSEVALMVVSKVL